ncbi:MAG: hypothetical protein EOO00_11655 [Chitinophagaceae bacterium]|nr:MAG: hypothetical protein EOO00_11655 [Chitinophagaceae bacterium]
MNSRSTGLDFVSAPDAPQLDAEKVLKLIDQISEQERHFNGIETQYRLLASTWLLASLGAIGYILQGDLTTVVDKKILIGSIGLVANIGIYLLWLLDIKVYHRLLHSAFKQGIYLEIKYDWLPRTRIDMLIGHQAGDVTRSTSLYYVCSTTLLGLIGAISFVFNFNETLPRLLVIIAFVILSVIQISFMIRSGVSSTTRLLADELRAKYETRAP